MSKNYKNGEKPGKKSEKLRKIMKNILKLQKMTKDH